MLGSFFAEHNLSFHAHSSKIGDPYDGSFLRVLGLHNSVLALHLQKKLILLHFHCKMPLKFSLRAPSYFTRFSFGMSPDPLALACYGC